MLRAILATLILITFAASARAQTWPVCFDEGAILKPEAYRALREAHAAMEAAPRFSSVATLQRQADYDEADPVAVERSRVVYLEAIRAGFSPAIEILTPYETGMSECAAITIRGLDRRAPLRMWHYYGVFFDSGSAVLDPRGWIQLQTYAATYRRGMRVILDGYTDTSGGVGPNLALSRRRVDAVADAFIRLGVHEEDIERNAYGETRRAKPTPDETAEPLNRRVWIDMRLPRR
jgi:outer membrane protein OmpA-like peptidoglycan-associated protein